MTHTQNEVNVIPTGTLAPAPELPRVLPGLSGTQLLGALATQRQRLNFLAEHLDHPVVSEGVADAILEARDAIDHAIQLHRRLVWGGR